MGGFLKIGDIAGESKQADHKGWIEIQSFSWGVSNAGSSLAGGSGAGRAGKVSVQDISITKVLDKSSPKLMEACCTGKTTQRAVLHLCRTKDDLQTYMEYTMEDCLISSYQTSSSSSGSEVPSDVLSLSFTKIELAYTEIDCSSTKPVGRTTGSHFIKI